MAILLLGAVVFLAGVMRINYPELCRALKAEDPQAWLTLGSPSGYSMTDMGKSIGVFSWVLARSYEASPSGEVRELGARAYRRAKLSRSLMLWGVAGIVGGALITLVGSIT